MLRRINVGTSSGMSAGLAAKTNWARSSTTYLSAVTGVVSIPHRKAVDSVTRGARQDKHGWCLARDRGFSIVSLSRDARVAGTTAAIQAVHTLRKALDP